MSVSVRDCEYDVFYRKYPIQMDKSAGERSLRKNIRSVEDLIKFSKVFDRYIKSRGSKVTWPEFCQQWRKLEVK